MFVFESYALPLPVVFKITKDVNTESLTETAIVDLTKYKEARIAVKYTPSPELTAFDKLQLERKQQMLDQGLISKFEYEQAESLIKLSRVFRAEIYAIEDVDEFFLAGTGSSRHSSSILIPSVPTKISIKVAGKGKYTLVIWAQ